MVARFFRDSAIYALPAALSRGISFLLFPLFAHVFSPSDYGTLDLLLVVSTLVAVTIGLEVSQAVGRFLADEDDPERRRTLASTALLFTAAAYTVFLALGILLAEPIARAFLGDSGDADLIRIAALWMWVAGVLQLAQNQLRWQLRPAAFAVAAGITAAVTAGCSGVFVLVLDMGVAGALLGQLAGASVALAYVAVATRGTFGWRFDRVMCRRMLAFSVPLVPAGVAVFLNAYADRLIIQHQLSLADVGVYGVGFRLALVVSLVLIGFQGAAMPLILARHADPHTPADIARILRLFAALVLPLFVLLSIMAPPALHVLADPAYADAATLVPFLALAILFAGMYMFAPGMSIAGDTVTMAKLTVAAGVANVVVVLALVPLLGIEGAALGTALTSLGWFAGQMWASQRRYPVPHHWPALAGGLVAACAAIGLAALVLPVHDVAPAWGDLTARAGLVVLGSAAAAWLALGGDEVAALRRRAHTWRRRNRLAA